MAFREKAAWGMGILMILCGIWYLSLALSIPAGAPAVAQLGAVIPFTLAVIVGSVVLQTVLAIMAPREAHRSADEREQVAIDRAGNWAGYVLAGGVVCGAIGYVASGDGNRLFLWVTAALILSQAAEYAFQIFLFRKSR